MQQEFHPDIHEASPPEPMEPAFHGQASGEPTSVSLRLPNGRVALADYRPGAMNRPAVLLLHGFLQTHQFGIIQSLASALSDQHYPVLAPTLTLGIDQRRQSLPCDAIQNHRLADGTEELAAWVEWLKARGHPAVVAVGHSSGAMRVLLYASEGTDEPALAGAVLISLGHFGEWNNSADNGAEDRRAQADVAAGDTSLKSYHLVFCDGDYLAPPDAYLSYRAADGARLLKVLRASRHPMVAIFGSADTHLPGGWIAAVTATGRDVRVIDGADHFFSGGHEFDLQDAVLDALGAIAPRIADPTAP